MIKTRNSNKIKRRGSKQKNRPDIQRNIMAVCRLKIKEDTINAFIIIATHDMEKQFIHSIYEYCFSIMEHTQREILLRPVIH